MKDTTDILRKLDAISSALDNANLVSLDLKSLYIRIPNAEGVKAVKESCDKKKKKKCDNKSIDNIFGSYSKLKQLCATLLALSSNKGLCHGYDMCIILCKYFHGSLCEEIYIYTLSFKDFHYSTYDSLMIYFLNGLVLKSNSQAF